jgi:hypothetical protein
VTQLRQIEASYLAHARLLKLDEWQQRSIFKRLAENICRLTSALQ